MTANSPFFEFLELPLNQWAKQGYVFEKPKETCKQMGEAVGNKSNILLMGNTHMY